MGALTTTGRLSGRRTFGSWMRFDAPRIARVDPAGAVAVPLTNVAGAVTGQFKAIGSEDAVEGRLGVQRDV